MPALPVVPGVQRETIGCVRVFAMKTLGVYVQVPFCQTRCTYCNFHTGVVAAERFGPYVEAVCAEIRRHGELYRAAGIEWGSGKWSASAEAATAGRRVESAEKDGGPGLSTDTKM